MCIHTFIQIYTCTHVHISMPENICMTYAQTYSYILCICVYLYECVNTQIYTCTHLYICMNVWTHVHISMPENKAAYSQPPLANMHTRVYSSHILILVERDWESATLSQAWKCVYMYICINLWIHMCVYTHTHVYSLHIHAFTHTYVFIAYGYIHTYLHIYIHIYKYIYWHIFIPENKVPYSESPSQYLHKVYKRSGVSIFGYICIFPETGNMLLYSLVWKCVNIKSLNIKMCQYFHTRE